MNDITPIATSAPHIPNGIFERIERSENIASVRVTPDPKWFMLAGRTFDLVCHDSNPCLTLGASAFISASLSRTAASRPQKRGSNQPKGLSYGRAGGFPKVIEATVRFIRPAGQAAAL